MKNQVSILAVVAALAMSSACENTGASSSTQASANAPTEGTVSAESAKNSTNNRERYDVVSPKAAVNVGETKTVKFAIEPAGGLKINHDYPWKVTFADAQGVEIANKTVGGSKIELADEAATIPVQLRASQEGPHKLAATGSFSVCNDTKCYVMRDENVEFELAATTPRPTEQPTEKQKGED